MNLGSQAAGIGALADETRRRLYEFVGGVGEPVGREQAARALDLPTHTASFHLDRLVDEGLLEVEFRRLSGRTGPGAGRPSKLYRRSDREFTVSLPPRHYDVVGAILASAIAASTAGRGLNEALETSAHERGRALGARRPRDATTGSDLTGLADTLADQGFEPRAGDHEVTLSNCPFHALAREHTELICGINRTFVQGVADGLGCAGVTAHLEPDPDGCCVVVRQA